MSGTTAQIGLARDAVFVGAIPPRWQGEFAPFAVEPLPQNDQDNPLLMVNIQSNGGSLGVCRKASRDTTWM